MRPDHPAEAQRPAAPRVVVAIDGPSGAGKSTVARALAQELGFAYLDTGAMFRAVALHLSNRGVDLADLAGRGVADALADLQMSLTDDGTVHLDGADVGERLRSTEVESIVSAVSALPAVRERMCALQRAFAARGSLVCEGRDMGTVVFPSAAFKFYLDASVEERARRRCGDFVARGGGVSVDEVRRQIIARDDSDATREIAPLVAAGDAERIDTTGMTAGQVVARLARAVRSAVATPGDDS